MDGGLSGGAGRTAPLVRETKWVSGRALPAVAESVVAACAEPDPVHPAGELESVYFETPGLDSWREKADGDALKRKVRVRWYRGGAAGPRGRIPVFLEIKDRIGSARDKARTAFEWDGDFLESAPLSDPGFAALLRAGAEAGGFALPLAALRPAVSIRYRRSRWICPATGSRLSVDSGVRCTRANETFLPFAGPLESPVCVVEAKSAVARAWPFSEALVRAGFRMCSFSKYGHFVERILAGSFR